MKCTYKEGTWELANLIGAQVRIRSISTSVRSLFGLDCEEEFQIKNIYFRVTEEGKIIPLFRLNKYTDKLFKAEELKILNMNPIISEVAICGETEGNSAVCGYGTSGKPGLGACGKKHIFGSFEIPNEAPLVHGGRHRLGIDGELPEHY